MDTGTRNVLIAVIILIVIGIAYWIYSAGGSTGTTDTGTPTTTGQYYQGSSQAPFNPATSTGTSTGTGTGSNPAGY